MVLVPGLLLAAVRQQQLISLLLVHQLFRLVGRHLTGGDLLLLRLLFVALFLLLRLLILLLLLLLLFLPLLFLLLLLVLFRLGLVLLRLILLLVLLLILLLLILLLLLLLLLFEQLIQFLQLDVIGEQLEAFINLFLCSGNVVGQIRAGAAVKKIISGLRSGPVQCQREKANAD